MGKTSFEKLEAERFDWSKRTFLNATANSSLLKAFEELRETKEELVRYQIGVRTPVCKAKLAEEYADVLMCIFDSAGRAGISAADLREAFEMKLEINKSRRWQKNADNTYSHVKE